MDIDEFLEREAKTEKKEEGEKHVSGEVPKGANAEMPDNIKDDVKLFFEHWKKIGELKFKWDNKLYTEVTKTIESVEKEIGKTLLTMGREKRAIKRLIGKALNDLENRNFEDATKLYSEISDMRDKIPDFMFEEKKELNTEIFLLYEKLHNQIDLKFIKDSKLSIAKTNTLIEDSFSNLNKGDVVKAKIFYEKAFDMYKELPNGFIQKKLDLGSGLLKLYKDLSIHTQIKELQQLLPKGGYLSSDDRLNQLAEIVKNKNALRKYPPPRPRLVTVEQHTPDKSLLASLIARKMERAKINLEKELYPEAKRNIESVLKVDPRNLEAKRLLSKIPIQN